MYWKCAKCGHAITAAKIVSPVRCKCGFTDRNANNISGEPKANAGVAKMIGTVATYSVAVCKWLSAGSPVRDAAEIQRIHDTICLPCEHYADGKCHKCGCRLSTLSGIIAGPRNKIAMATEHCPIGKW